MDKVLQTQLFIANFIGSFAILISVLPFFTMVFSQIATASSLTDSKNNYSFFGGIFKVYVWQIAISFSFMVFVILWDLTVKKEEYKLEGSGHAFELWWGNWEAGMNSASEALKGLYAYQGLVRVPFETFFSLMMIGIPIVAIIIASFKTSQGRVPQYKEGSRLIEQVFNNVLFVVGSMALFIVYLKIIDMSLRMPVTAVSLVQGWWKALLF